MELPSPTGKRFNILVLDGGGVRGLSSLLILRALMAQINQSLALLSATSCNLDPQDVFQLVAGTSTGGLIALMLGKMGMTVDQCIEQYEALSKVIFGRKHFRGRLTFGLAPTRYSGKRLHNCVKSLLQDRQMDKDIPMSHHADDKIACAVICREHSSPSKYSKLKHSAVPICSLHCSGHVSCTVRDAARATSAAPTFFPVKRIGDRYFADGGLAHNNPSKAILFHYRRIALSKRKKIRTPGASSVPLYSAHGDLDCSFVRFINIGTGAKPSELEPGKQERLKAFIPGAIRQAIFLTQTLKEIAVSSFAEADSMRILETAEHGLLSYERFDANHGVSNVKLDDYRALGDLRTKTNLYLEEQETKDHIEEVATAIATEYFEAQPKQSPDTEAVSSPVEDSAQRPEPPKTLSVASPYSYDSAYNSYSQSTNLGAGSEQGDDNIGNGAKDSSGEQRLIIPVLAQTQPPPKFVQEDTDDSGLGRSEHTSFVTASA